MPIRIDNIFYVTSDVDRLSSYYGALVNVPPRRAQVEAPGLMWAEVSLGGMEMSFRKASATTQVHPRGEDEFLEISPGAGVTISFEVEDTDTAIERLSARGCKFYGKPLICTGGAEVISIFEDPSGRPVQLYEPRFGSYKHAAIAASRQTMTRTTQAKAHSTNYSSAMSQERITAALGLSQADPASRWGYITTREVYVGSNLRDGRNLSYSVAFYDADLDKTKSFYRDALGLQLVYETADRLRFDVDGTIVEFRAIRTDDPYLKASGKMDARSGGIAMIEVRSLTLAEERMEQLKIEKLAFSHQETDEVDRRAAYRDIDNNVFEFWERPNSAPLITAQLGGRNSAELEHWEFHSFA